MLEDNEVLTDCGIRPSEPLSLTKYDLRSADVVCKIIMKVGILLGITNNHAVLVITGSFQRT